MRHPRVALVSHVTFHRYAARALSQAGLLDRYLTTPLRSRPLRSVGLGPAAAAVERFNRTRVFPELKGVRTTPLWAAFSVASAASRVIAPRDQGRAFRVAAEAWDLEACLRQGHSEILHFPSGIGLRSARRAARRGTRLVCDQRLVQVDAHHERIGAAYRELDLEARDPVLALRPRIVAEHALADLIICNSDYCRRTFLERGTSEDRVVTVRLGCDPSGFSPPEHPPERFTVLFAGRFTPEKGAATFAAAVGALDHTSRVVVAGDARALGQRLLSDIEARLELVGHVAASGMPDIFRDASVLVLPSFSDGWGMVVMEAMASGLPVIVTDCTGAADVVDDGVNGYVIRVGDAEGLADRLQMLAGDPDRVQRMGAAARQTALANTWDTYGARLLEVYGERLGVRG